MKIELFIHDTHSFCELPDGRLLFAKNRKELEEALDMAASLGMFDMYDNNVEITEGEEPRLTYNR